MNYDNLRDGSRVRLNRYRQKAARTLETVRKHHAPESPYRLSVENDPQPWKRERFITPHGLGFNAPGGVFTRSKDGRTIYGDTGSLNHLRKLSREDTPPEYGRGWYADEYCSETVTGHVAVLPSRKDGPRFLAYIVWSDCDGITIDAEPFKDAHAAWSCADDMARYAAEEEREHNEKWNAAREVYEHQEEQREELRAAHADARGLVAVLRDLPQAADSRATICDMLRECRARMRRALHAIAKDAETLADYSAQGVDV
jgi:hypothetical protein